MEGEITRSRVAPPPNPPHQRRGPTSALRVLYRASRLTLLPHSPPRTPGCAAARPVAVSATPGQRPARSRRGLGTTAPSTQPPRARKLPWSSSPLSRPATALTPGFDHRWCHARPFFFQSSAACGMSSSRANIFQISALAPPPSAATCRYGHATFSTKPSPAANALCLMPRGR